jgi:hypothetical protein
MIQGEGNFIINLNKIKEEEENARKNIKLAEDKRKQEQEIRKKEAEREIERFKNEKKEEIENKKKELNKQEENLKNAEILEINEIEKIKNEVETKKDEIIKYIINNITQVDLTFPESVKKRMVKKKKKHNK